MAGCNPNATLGARSHVAVISRMLSNQGYAAVPIRTEQSGMAYNGRSRWLLCRLGRCDLLLRKHRAASAFPAGGASGDPAQLAAARSPARPPDAFGCAQ